MSPEEEAVNDRLQQLTEAGVSIWLDDLSRERLETGNLEDLVKNSHVVGVTSNPSIFQAALAHGERYDEQIRELAGQGADTDQAVRVITTDDVRNGCLVLRPVFDATESVDGRVSIEVSPGLADDAAGTVVEAAELWKTVGEPNLFIKIPGTTEGCRAITETLGAGISVNVTLIFGLDQYHDVMEAHFAGLEKARDNGHDLATIHSVASFFVSRVDTEIDKRLESITSGPGTDPALRGKAGVANARLAFQAYEKFFAGDRWDSLEADGARRQRPLWASTGVKNPDYDDTMYVVDLVVEDTVNTMPEKTLDAVADHGEIRGDRVRPFYDDAAAHMSALADAGIDYDDVIAVLIKEGVDKFVTAWSELGETVTAQLEEAKGAS
jgi:transaldolase